MSNDVWQLCDGGQLGLGQPGNMSCASSDKDGFCPCRPDDTGPESKEQESVKGVAAASAQPPAGLMKDQGPPLDSWEDADGDS